MVWDDTPMYERNTEQKRVDVYVKAENSGTVKRSVPWAYEVLGKSRGIPTGAPSPLYSWWQREDEKRKRGVDNEIDRADIIQASKGVKNTWTDRYKANPAKFSSIINPHMDKNPVVWADILAATPKIELTEPVASAKMVAKLPNNVQNNNKEFDLPF
jgi:hypothetical protein